MLPPMLTDSRVCPTPLEGLFTLSGLLTLQVGWPWGAGPSLSGVFCLPFHPAPSPAPPASAAALDAEFPSAS